jgi:hypothetical protein
MTSWRGRRCRAALASTLRAAGISAVTVAVLAAPAVARTDEGPVADPRDVGIHVDLKSLTHARDGSSIVYTAETYAPFSDQSAVLKWGIDRDGDEAFDLIVFTEWRAGKLAGGVKDSGGRQVAAAAVSRPGPAAIRVTFPAEVLGGADVYRYAVDAGSTADERDMAPNSGLIHHRLGAVTPPEAQPVRTAGSAPAEPAGGAASVAAAPTPQPATKAAPKPNLPTTGPGNRLLVQWSGTALMAGGALVSLGAQRRRVRRRQGTGGIR